MFQTISPAPPDSILGLTAAFRADPRPGKVNLAVGVYKDEHGRTPVLDCVKEAEARLLKSETTKGYLPIEGPPSYGRAVRELLLPAGDARITDGSAVTAATPGGTGALRVAGDFLKQSFPDATVWFSRPTWPNHPGIFTAAGLKTATYAWLDAAGFALDFEATLADLDRVKAGDVVVLHGCCHNPTGVDPDARQWDALADVLARRGALPGIDLAYQGFGEGVEPDVAGLRAALRRCPEAIVCSSFSKNFGLYNERVGALTVFTSDADAGKAVLSRVQLAVRRNYSNPPSHGLAVVDTVLADAALTRQWRGELDAMRQRILAMRRQLREGLDRRGIHLAPDGNAFVEQQRGMFTMTGLSPDAVKQLKDDHAIYIVGDGRINVAGLNDADTERLCEAIAAS